MTGEHLSSREENCTSALPLLTVCLPLSVWLWSLDLKATAQMLDTTACRRAFCAVCQRALSHLGESRLHILVNALSQLADTSICMFLHSVAVTSYLLRTLLH